MYKQTTHGQRAVFGKLCKRTKNNTLTPIFLAYRLVYSNTPQSLTSDLPSHHLIFRGPQLPHWTRVYTGTGRGNGHLGVLGS